MPVLRFVTATVVALILDICVDFGWHLTNPWQDAAVGIASMLLSGAYFDFLDRR